ncbi:MAG: SDR family NAD(P)-dependent oxidoreductase [Acidobacteria bacterium]|nr:SDR family NAD(P)-dependent oxidoreductase [Acidobacteriota bacterium]
MSNTITQQNEVWVMTGPTSGIGRRAARELAHRGIALLVGRDPGKLREPEKETNEPPQGNATSVDADFADVLSVRSAAEQIAAPGLPIAGVANNAGGMQTKGGVSKQGWDIARHQLPGPAGVHGRPDPTSAGWCHGDIHRVRRRGPGAETGNGGRFPRLAVPLCSGGRVCGGGRARRIRGWRLNPYGLRHVCHVQARHLAAVVSLARQYPRVR